MSEIQANCPHCGTAFTVTSKQLEVANGHVRCGVCMEVFKVGGKSPEAAKDTQAQTSQKPASGNTSSLDEDASIEAWIKKNQKPRNPNMQSGPVEAPEESPESLSIDDEFSDAFEMLKPVSESGEKSYTAMPKDNEENDEPETVSIPAYKATLADDDNNDEEMDHLLANAKQNQGTKAQQKNNNKSSLSLDDESDDAFNNGFDNDLFSSGDDEPLLQVALGSADIEDEPSLESQLKPKILWPTLSVIFSIILLVQVSIKNFDELSMNPDYRGVYAGLCSLGLCELPPLSNVDSIRGSNLLVRPHPKQPGALVVDAIINNQAAFDQAFPDLYLSFSNLQGKVIASRLFTPDEYLQSELKGMQQMPSRSPLHLSLEVLDPGKEAVSYHLDFVKGS